MSNDKMIRKARKHIDDVVDFLGVETLNLVIRRHHLSEDKRNYFIIRYAETDPTEERKYTEKMEEIKEEIMNIDEELYKKGVQKKWRLEILRDIKKLYPYDWESGFVLEK